MLFVTVQVRSVDREGRGGSNLPTTQHVDPAATAFDPQGLLFLGDFSS